MGIRVRRIGIEGLKDLDDVILLVPDASQMMPGTRSALDKWIAQEKPVIVFGDVPAKWALQYGIHVVEARRNVSNPIKYNTINFPADNLSITGSLTKYTSFIAKEAVALLTVPGSARGKSTFVCRKGSLLFCGWSPRPHTWDIIGEQDEHRFFARILKEFNVNIAAPDISSERISNLKGYDISDWGLWNVSSVDYRLASYGFSLVYPYTFTLDVIDQRFKEEFLSSSQISKSIDIDLERTAKVTKQEHDGGIKVFFVVAPFYISPCLYDELLQRDGLQFRYTNGVLHPTYFWSPADTLLKRLAVQSIKNFLSKQHVDGIFIDFARYLDGNFDYGPAMKKSFEKHIGKYIDNWPKAVIEDPNLSRLYAAFKRKIMTNFLGEFGLAAKQMQKDIVIEALFYWNFWPEKGGAYENIGQDPKALVEMGAIDRACGIFYTSDNAELETLIDQGIKDVGCDAFSCILAPLSFFNEYGTSSQLFEQIKILKSKGVKHASILTHVPRQLLYNRFEKGQTNVENLLNKNINKEILKIPEK
jgi:hypothetical protein